MVTFPICKINLGLQIKEKRQDGFHNLETVFYPINWKDVVEIIPSKSDGNFSASGINIDPYFLQPRKKLKTTLQKIPEAAKFREDKLFPHPFFVTLIRGY